MYNLVVALPSSKTKPRLPEKQLQAIVDAFARGENAYAIAKRLEPHDQAKRKRIRRQIEKHSTDPRVAELLAHRARQELMVGLVPTVRAIRKRAARGRTDAGKIVLEASGFHNPRVKHEHSGDIKVTLDMPRPKFEQDQGAIDLPDADVVED